MRDRDLVRLYWPVELRPAFDALFDLDEAMAEVVASSTQPALGAIRLAWWREALERLDASPPPPEPRLQGAAAELLNRGISGAMLAGLEDGWATLLDDEPDIERVAERGDRLFAIAGQLLGGNDDRLSAAGRLYACSDAGRRGLIRSVDGTPYHSSLAGHRFSRTLRPLTALARLAVRDLEQAPVVEQEATPRRAAALLAHRLFGTLG